MNDFDSHDFGSYRASADLVRKMNGEMQRDGYELDPAINFLHALSEGARAAADWAEAELA